MDKKKRDFLISLATGLLIAAAAFVSGGSKGFPLVHRLCDACFAAGALLVCWSGLVFCTKKGAFDMMGYSLISVFHLTFPATAPKDEDREDFLAYRDRKEKKRTKSPVPSLLAGLLYLVLATAFLIVYHTIS